MATWASIPETATYTGITVSQTQLDIAQFMVELFADVVYEQTGNLSVKNARLLKMAVAYQAAWVTDHPDLFTHVDITTMNQDGIFYVQRNENAYVLAPMAKRAISRLSWKRNRSIKVRPSTRRIVSKQFVDASDYELIESYNYHTPEQDDNVDWDQE